ncbi:hypothetical protein [Paraburkholderia heleia]|nr:hypothetical protein [Paraburkholderia heleia]
MLTFHFYCWTWVELAFVIDDFGNEILLLEEQFVRAVAFKASEVH